MITEIKCVIFELVCGIYNIYDLTQTLKYILLRSFVIRLLNFLKLSNLLPSQTNKLNSTTSFTLFHDIAFL